MCIISPMSFTDYIETHHVFSTADAIAIAASKESAVVLLNRAYKDGKIERVRRGTYVSKTGKYYGETVDQFEVVVAVDPNAVLSYHSALVAHGVAHSVSSVCSFRSAAVRSKFEYNGISYRPYPADAKIQVQTIRAKAFGSATVTTREQTAIDCLTHPGYAGGIEEVIRSLSAFPYLDLDALDKLVATASASNAARFGWLLEAKKDSWHVSDEFLNMLKGKLGKGPARLDPATNTSQNYVGKWQLYLPASEREVLSWLS
jgi:predicted transcriptional regulator of viral defense system